MMLLRPRNARHRRRLLAIALVIVTYQVAPAGDVFTGVHGTIDFTDSTMGIGQPFTNATPCFASNPPGPGPVITTMIFGANPIKGDLAGSVTGMGVNVNGHFVPSSLLPMGSFYRQGVFQRDVSFCECCHTTCPMVAPKCTLFWNIGTASGMFPPGSEEIFLSVPASDTVDGLIFSFAFCGKEFIWGGGCNIGGSSDYSWTLHVPGALRATVFAGGNEPAYNFSGIGVTIDFDASPGGLVTAMEVDDDLPVPPPPLTDLLSKYWEMTTDMATGSFSADLSIEYDSDPPFGVGEEDLKIWRYDDATSTWQMLMTTVDTVTRTATAQGIDHLGIFGIGNGPTIPEVNGITLEQLDQFDPPLTQLGIPAIGEGVAFDVVGDELTTILLDADVSGAECLAGELEGSTWIDARPDPQPGEAYYYLVRASTTCCNGTYGASSASAERVPDLDCP